MKTEIVEKLITPALIHSIKIWALTNKHKSRINKMEMKFMRKYEEKLGWREECVFLGNTTDKTNTKCHIGDTIRINRPYIGNVRR